MIYKKHELEVVKLDWNKDLVMCYSQGGDDGYSYDSVNPGNVDS